MKTKTIQVRLSNEEYEAIKRVVKDGKTPYKSVSDYVRTALKHEKIVREMSQKNPTFLGIFGI